MENIRLVDSHCHIDWLPKLHDQPIDALMAAARDNGVSHFLCVSIHLDDFQSMIDTVSVFDDVHFSVGQHPNEAIDQEPTVAQLIELAQTPKVVAIGETGLDYFRSEAKTPWQQQRFIRHIEAARQLHLPLIIHSRDAKEDTVRIMTEAKAAETGGVMHCFTEDWSMAKQCLDLNFYLSFSGIVTFNSAKSLQEVAQKAPLDRILIETDCPYLAPAPYRGKPNQPAYVRYVAQKIAELRGITLAEVAQATTENFYRLFPGAL